MSYRRAVLFFSAMLGLFLAFQALATTWGEVEVVCPVSGTKNTFLAPMSSGSYIYGWPSKYQLVFWPFTDTASVYSCKKCYYTTFMGDFEDLPVEKVAAVRSLLSGVHLEKKERYTMIPMSDRLAVAEKVYRELEMSEAFWCHFYRVQGYHLQSEGKPEAAKEARWKAVHSVEKLMMKPEESGHRREHLFIRGSMRYFLGDKNGALRDLIEAKAMRYTDEQLKPEQLNNYNEYLDELLIETLAAVKEGKDLSDVSS